MSSLPAGSFGSRPSGLPVDALISFGIELAEFAVGTRVAKVVDELILGYFHLDRVRRGLRESHFRPRLVSHQAKTDEQDDRRRGPDDLHRVVAVGVVGALAAVAKAKYRVRQAQLRQDEYRAGDDQRKVVLMIDLIAHRRDRRRRFP